MLLSRRLSRVRVLPDGFPITSFGTEAATTVSGCNLLAVGNSAKSSTRGRQNVLLTIAIILFVMWLLGMVTSYTLGGFLHLLLVLAIIAMLIRVIQGRNPI